MTDPAPLLALAHQHVSAAIALCGRAHDHAWSPLRGTSSETGPVTGTHDHPPPSPLDRDAGYWWRRSVRSVSDLHRVLGRMAEAHHVAHGGWSAEGHASAAAVGQALIQARRTIGLLQAEDLGAYGPEWMAIADHAHDVAYRMGKAAGPGMASQQCVWGEDQGHPCGRKLGSAPVHDHCLHHVCSVCHMNRRPPGRTECDGCRQWKRRKGTTQGKACWCHGRAA